MKKLALLTLFILPFALLAQAAEETDQWFVGLDAGVSGAKLKTQETETARAYGGQYGLKVGYQEGNGRVYLAYDIASDIGTYVQKTQTPYLALEGVSNEFVVIGSVTAKFFFGFHLGASIADVQNSDTNTTSSVTALMGGAQTGLLFQLPAGFEIPLAYRHSFTFKDDLTNYNAGNLYTGLTYKF